MEPYSGGVLARRPLVYVELLMEAGQIESLVESLMKTYSTTGSPLRFSQESLVAQLTHAYSLYALGATGTSACSLYPLITEVGCAGWALHSSYRHYSSNALSSAVDPWMLPSLLLQTLPLCGSCEVIGPWGTHLLPPDNGEAKHDLLGLNLSSRLPNEQGSNPRS